MISVCIPCLNESDENLARVIKNLTEGCEYDDMEIIVWNDGSVNDDGSFRPMSSASIPWENKTVLNSTKRRGVGYGFDRCVEHALGDVIVLMGADTYPQRSWLKHVLNTVKSQSVGCGVSVGLQPGSYDINAEGLYERYGARIIYMVGIDDLPKSSPLRKDPYYKDILEAKWQSKQSDEPYEIPCVYGAFYWLTKEFYQKMHGWDTVEGEEWKGHKYWGCLEPAISLKAKVYGGRGVLYPDFRVGHIFGRIDDIFKVRSVRTDLKYWNALWVAHTMLDDAFRDEVLAFPKQCLNLSQAQGYIKKNWGKVQDARQRNKREGNLISKK